MAQSTSALNGILVVDKPGLTETYVPRAADSTVPEPKFLTSHDVVQWVRRSSRQRRIGHTGTLDPMASGVLVLCLGQSTRLVEYYQGHAKQYFAEITLGTATDTYDALGKVTETRPVPPLDHATVEAAVAQFRGELLQTPPVFSALKQGGESVHRKARRGESVELPPRRITVHELSLVNWIEPERVILRLRCSAGTYVRSLAYDLGQALGTVAHLSSLRREMAGAFSLTQAHQLAALEAIAEPDDWSRVLLPPGTGLGLPRLTLHDGEIIRRLGFGQKVAARWTDGDSDLPVEYTPSEAAPVAALDTAGRFCGVVHCIGRSDQGLPVWKAAKWLIDQ